MAASYLAAESALQRFIHAFFCCPAGVRERGKWVTHPSTHWLVLWKCVGNDPSHLALSLSITYTQTNASEECREKACSFKATAWEVRDPGDTATFPQTQMCGTHIHSEMMHVEICMHTRPCTHTLKLLQWRELFPAPAISKPKRALGNFGYFG